MLDVQPRSRATDVAAGARRCVACDAERFTPVRILADLGAERCERCRLLIATFEAAEGDGAGYDRIDARAYETSIAAVRAREASTLLGLIGPLVPRGARWLDVGCGAGVQLEAAQRQGFAVHGVEPDASARRMAGERIGAAHVGASVDELDADAFDVVSYLDVLEHIRAEELPATAQRTHRLLRDGGHWIVKVPSSDGFFFRFAHAAARVARPHVVRSVVRRLWLRDYPSPHRVYFNARNLERFLRANGFSPLVVTYVPTVPLGTVLARLRLDREIAVLEALATLPAVLALSALEHVLKTTDSLVVIARKEPLAT